MITELICTFLILSFVYLIQRCYVTPRRKMKKYVDLFQAQGYRVLAKKYHPLYNHFYEVLKKNSNQLGDSLKVTRQEYPKYDVVVANLMSQPLVQILSPNLIQSYFSLDKHYLYTKIQIPIDFISMVTGNGLSFSEGSQWKRKRLVYNKLFNFQFLKAQTNPIAQICEKSFHKFEGDIKINQNGEKYIQTRILDSLIQITSKVVISSFLGLQIDQKIEGTYIPAFLTQLIDDSVRFCRSDVGFFFGPKFIKLGLRAKDRQFNRRNGLYREWAISAIKKKISMIQQKHKKNQKSQSTDIIQAFFLEKQKNSQSITSEQEIFNELSNFLFAGTDTTSHFLQAMIYYIATNPEVEIKVREEINKFMATDDYSYENLKKMTYIDNIQKQTIRLYGPGVSLFCRRAKQDNLIGNIPIKKGTILSVYYMRNHYSEQFFVRPTQFRPERWESECDNLPSYVFNGFSGGARTCIGKHLALLESKIILIKFLKRYRKIVLPKQELKILVQFLICMEKMDVKLYLNQTEK